MFLTKSSIAFIFSYSSTYFELIYADVHLCRKCYRGNNECLSQQQQDLGAEISTVLLQQIEFHSRKRDAITN